MSSWARRCTTGGHVGKKRQRTVTGDCIPIPLPCEGGSLRSYRFLFSTGALTNRGIGVHESRRKMHPQAKCFGRSLRKGLKRDLCRSLQRDTPCLWCPNKGVSTQGLFYLAYAELAKGSSTTANSVSSLWLGILFTNCTSVDLIPSQIQFIHDGSQ